MKKSSKESINIMKKYLFTFILCIFMLCVVEWTGRIYISWRRYVQTPVTPTQKDDWGITFVKMTVVDPDVGCVFKKGSKRGRQVLEESACDFELVDLGVDSILFRDKWININRKKVLLAVGDSFVWGYGVQSDKIFSEVLESMDKNLDIINAGMIGYTPQQYTRLVRKFINNNVRFDGVIYNFFAGNDVSGEHSFRQWSKNIKKFPDLAPPGYMRIELIANKAVEYETEKRSSVKNEKKSISFIEFFLEEWLVSFRIARRIYWMLVGEVSFKQGLNPFQVLAGNNIQQDININRRYYIFPENPKVKGLNGEKLILHTCHLNEAACETISESRVHEKAQIESNFPLAIESIVEAKKLCDGLKKDFYLVYIPTKAEVYADELCDSLDGAQKSIIRKKLNTLHDKLISKCNSLGIKVIDLTSECIAYKKKGVQLYFSQGPHFNASGHKLWAEVVYGVLKKSLAL